MKSPEQSSQIDPLLNPEIVVTPEDSEKFLENVVFKEITDKNGRITGYKSSSKDRKLIELPASAEIEPGKPYKIRIKEDTKPEDSMSGKFVAEVVRDEGQPLSLNQWDLVENNVDEAEVSKRKSNALRTDDFEFAPTFESDKNTEKILSDLGIEPLDDSDVGSIVAEKEAHEQTYKKLLGEDDSPEKALVSLKWKNLSRAMKTESALDRERERVVEYETGIIRKMLEKQDSGQSVSAERIMLNKAGEKERALEKADKTLRQSSPEAWYGLNLKELKRYKEELESGKIVETDYVRRQAEEVVEHVRAGQPVFIHGHLGSGKTELAFHTARKYFGKEALIISGSKHTSPAELYGHQILSLRDVDPEESEDRYKAFLKTATDEMDRWKRENNKATEKEVDQQFDLIKSGLQERLAHEYRSGTVSDYFMGQVYQAMQEGRPIILDEVNAIPHDVLISLNHLLTRKVGDVIRIQQNSGSEVTIKEGFGFILTGNINEGGADRYVMRQDLDPAFLSRLHLMKHDYLPQVKEGSFDEAPLGDGKGGKNELFELMASRVMDKNGNIEIPDGELRKLWNLAKAARATEDNFAGGSVEKTQFFRQGGGTQPIEYRLKEGVLSIRGINKIITAWQNDGYRNELDQYVFSEFVNQPTKLSDKAYLYQLFKDQYGFFQKQNWDQNPNYGSKGIVSSFKVNAPKNPAPKIEFMGPRQVIDVVYGNGPKREKWPDYRKKGSEAKTAAPEIEFTAKLAEFDTFKDESSKRIEVMFNKINALAKGDPKREGAIKMYDEYMPILNRFDKLSENATQLSDLDKVTDTKKQLEEKIKALESFMSTGESLSLKEAQEIMGKNFFGPKEVESALGLKFNEKLPEIKFSKDILEKLKDTHQLILYGGGFRIIPETGSPFGVSGQEFESYFKNKKKDGTPLISNDWFKDEVFYKNESSDLKWKIVSKELIKDSTSKNYIEQTEVLYEYVRNLYGFDDIDKIPNDVMEALHEWDNLKRDTTKFEELKKFTVSSDETEWKSAAGTLESLKLTQLFRESFSELLYRTILAERATDERLLPDKYSWTKSRTSSGHIVCAGGFGDAGAYVHWSEPGYWNSRLGCTFSAEKL